MDGAPVASTSRAPAPEEPHNRTPGSSGLAASSSTGAQEVPSPNAGEWWSEEFGERRRLLWEDEKRSTSAFWPAAERLMHEDSIWYDVIPPLERRAEYDWERPLASETLTGLRDRRHRIFSLQRKVGADEELQRDSYKTVAAYVYRACKGPSGRYSQQALDLRDYVSFCRTVDVPAWPVTNAMAVLFYTAAGTSASSRALVDEHVRKGPLRMLWSVWRWRQGYHTLASWPGAGKGCLEWVIDGARGPPVFVDKAPSTPPEAPTPPRRLLSRKARSSQPVFGEIIVDGDTSDGSRYEESEDSDQPVVVKTRRLSRRRAIPDSDDDELVELDGTGWEDEDEDEDVEQLPCPLLPDIGDSFPDVSSLYKRVIQAVVPVYGIGVHLVYHRTLRCNRRGTGCRFGINWVDGEVAESSCFEHNHGADERILEDPAWRPVLKNEEATAALAELEDDVENEESEDDEENDEDEENEEDEDEEEGEDEAGMYHLYPPRLPRLGNLLLPSPNLRFLDPYLPPSPNPLQLVLFRYLRTPMPMPAKLVQPPDERRPLALRLRRISQRWMNSKAPKMDRTLANRGRVMRDGGFNPLHVPQIPCPVLPRAGDRFSSLIALYKRLTQAVVPVYGIPLQMQGAVVRCNYVASGCPFRVKLIGGEVAATSVALHNHGPDPMILKYPLWRPGKLKHKAALAALAELDEEERRARRAAARTAPTTSTAASAARLPSPGPSGSSKRTAPSRTRESPPPPKRARGNGDGPTSTPFLPVEPSFEERQEPAPGPSRGPPAGRGPPSAHALQGPQRQPSAPVEPAPPPAHLTSLTNFLSALSPTLVSLAHPFSRSGLSSIRLLTAFSTLEPALRRPLFDEVEEKTGTRVTEEQIEALERGFEAAFERGYARAFERAAGKRSEEA
ncbi:hypothetical protein JCM8097_003794 [Rhodosporidiobolus ruineniae]